MRRIEALSGWGALRHLQAYRSEVEAVAGLLKAAPGELGRKVTALREEAKALEKEVARLRAEAAKSSCADLTPEVVAGVPLLARQVEAADMEALRALMDDLRSRIPSGVLALAADLGGKAGLVVSVSKDLHGRFTAPALIKAMAAAVGGGGGGRPDLAQAGGAQPQGIPEALAILRRIVTGEAA